MGSQFIKLVEVYMITGPWPDRQSSSRPQPPLVKVMAEELNQGVERSTESVAIRLVAAP